MDDRSLEEVKATTAELQALVDEDAKRIDKVSRSLNAHTRTNNFAGLFYTAFQLRERKNQS